MKKNNFFLHIFCAFEFSHFFVNFDCTTISLHEFKWVRDSVKIPRCSYRVHICPDPSLNVVWPCFLWRINHVGVEVFCINLNLFGPFRAKNEVVYLELPCFTLFHLVFPLEVMLVRLAWTDPPAPARFARSHSLIESYTNISKSVE